MFYKAKVAVCSEIRTKHKHNVGTTYNCRMLKLVYIQLPLGFKKFMSDYCFLEQ
jgi:hypothetical protein